MTRDHDNNPENESKELSEFARDPFGRAAEEEQPELEGLKPTYEEDYDKGYDEDGDYDDDPYDEPERDTPYAPAFREDEPEGELDQNLNENLEQGDEYFEEPSEQPLFQEIRPDDDMPEQGEDPLAPLYLEDIDEEEPVDEDTPDDGDQWNMPRLSATEEPWQDEQDYDDTPDNNEYTQRLPMGLLMIAGLAVILLIAGGYGVMQQRAESSEEIRQLRAALATAASNEDVEKVLVEADALRNENSDLLNRVYDLQIENRKLTDTVAGLEAQAEAANKAKQAANKPAAAQPKKQPTPKPAPKPSKPAPAVAQASVSPGTWFVNFGSYGQQSVAESWRGKLAPSSGNVITAASERDGRTFYRVRIVNLADKDTANAVARALEKQYGLSRLWVGQQ